MVECPLCSFPVTRRERVCGACGIDLHGVATKELSCEAGPRRSAAVPMADPSWYRTNQEGGVRHAIQHQRDRRWRVLVAVIPPRGVTLRRRPGVVGRAADPRAVRFEYAGHAIVVIDQGLGVFRRLRLSTELASGTRLRLGRQTLLYRSSAWTTQAMHARDDPSDTLPLLGYLVELQEDGTERNWYPIPATGVVLGRKARHADIVFRSDALVSARHVELRGRGGSAIAADLGSRNGTYVSIPDRAVVRPGEVFLVGTERLRVVSL